MDYNDLFAIDAKSDLISFKSTGPRALGQLIKCDSARVWLVIEVPASSHYFALVRIKDLNDNGPIFSRDSYYVSIQEDAPIEFVITRLNAHDPDSSLNIQYYLDMTDKKTRFLFRIINKRTSDIYVNAPLDYEQRQRYELTVTAVDA